MEVFTKQVNDNVLSVFKFSHFSADCWTVWAWNYIDGIKFDVVTFELDIQGYLETVEQLREDGFLRE